MSIQVTTGAVLACTFGMAPSSLTVVPMGPPVQAGGALAANVASFAPLVNVAPFGMCNSPANPVVASATAAALGVLTPMPCVPATASPWTPGSATVTVSGQPALTSSCTLSCMWGGVITVSSPGSATTVLTG